MTSPVAVAAILHLAAAAFMTGLIWFVQLVHYPLFSRVGSEAYVRYQREHMRRTTRVVGPAMLVELGAALLLAVDPPPGRSGLAWGGLALLAVIWAHTGFVMVPLHGRLANSYDAGVARALVRHNRLRTAAWTARTAVAALLLG